MMTGQSDFHRHWSGVINVYKPAGITSLQAVNHFKYNLPCRPHKIGHLGTLDPFAEGVLLVALGMANRLTDFVHQQMPKTYLAEGILGEQTDTGDLLGEVVERHTPIEEKHTVEQLQQLFSNHFCDNEYWQAPPIYSAAKHQGKALYAWAREGKAVQKPAVKRKIYNLTLLEYNYPKVRFEVQVSSGTYIRTLFEDMAKLLGTVGHLTRLIRTAIGPHKVEQSLNRTDWHQPPLLSLCEFWPLPIMKLSAMDSHKYLCGQRISWQSRGMEDGDQYYWISSSEEKILGLAERVFTPEGAWLMAKMNLPIV